MPLEMNAEIRARWVAALRSGDYEQGESNLRTGDRFCCLGVLCELAVADGLPLDVVAPGDPEDDEDQIWLYGDKQDYLPELVREWAGLAESNPHVMASDGQGAPEMQGLASLNDDLKWDFAEIADAIEGAR